jgi:serine/threonine protein kinase
MLCGPSRIAKVADFGLASLELERLKTEARRLNIAASRGVGKMMTGGVGSLRYMVRASRPGGQSVLACRSCSPGGLRTRPAAARRRRPPWLPRPAEPPPCFPRGLPLAPAQAPENYRGEAYTHTVDQYSFAVILYELLMRERAFEGMFLTPEMIADGASGAKKLRPPVPAVWPDEIKSLLERCWHTQADKRPPFKQVAQEISTLFLNGSPETNKLLKRIASGSKRGLLETMGIKRSV